MQRDEILALFDNITVWKSGEARAPHKPLLLLYALGKCSRGEDRYIPYSEIDKHLKELLVEFGPHRQAVHPEYPFWRLPNDGLWELSSGAEALRQKLGKRDPSKSDLLDNDIHGGLPASIYNILKKSPRLLNQIVENILEKTFPLSLHEDVIRSAGLDQREPTHQRRRDVFFQSRVLRAYENRCAICGFDVQLNNIPVGIEASHIKWQQAGGPNSEDNGLALCVMHQKLFDRGAITISKDYTIIVSQLVKGSCGLQELLLSFHNQPLMLPKTSIDKPNSRYIDWHRSQIFQGSSQL